MNRRSVKSLTCLCLQSWRGAVCVAAGFGFACNGVPLDEVEPPEMEAAAEEGASESDGIVPEPSSADRRSESPRTGPTRARPW
jgi:hypothetical protein